MASTLLVGIGGAVQFLGVLLVVVDIRADVNGARSVLQPGAVRENLSIDFKEAEDWSQRQAVADLERLRDWLSTRLVTGVPRKRTGAFLALAGISLATVGGCL